MDSTYLVYIDVHFSFFFHTTFCGSFVCLIYRCFKLSLLMDLGYSLDFGTECRGVSNTFIMSRFVEFVHTKCHHDIIITLHHSN